MIDRKTAHLSRRRLIWNSTVAAAAGVVLPECYLAQARSEDASKAGDAFQRWTIGNDQISRTIVFKPGAGLYTENFSDLATGATFISPDGLRMDMATEFSFECNGRSYYGSKSQFELLGAKESRLLNGRSLTVRLRHNRLGLEVAVIYISYDGHPAIRKHLVLRNTGAGRLRFTHLNIEGLGLSFGPENETTLNTQYGTVPREIFYTGRSEDAGLMLANSRTAIGVAVLSEVPGYMKRTEIGGWDDPERVRLNVLYDTDLMPFERSVSPGEEFKTASVSLATFRHGDGFHDPRWVLPSYTAQVLERRVDAQGPPWIYNTWEPFERGINHDMRSS